MIRMGREGGLVVVLDRTIQATGRTIKGVKYYSARWAMSVNPLGRIVGVRRRWEGRQYRQRTLWYRVEPVDPRAGFGELVFYPKQLRRPTREEIRAAVEAGLVHEPDK